VLIFSDLIQLITSGRIVAMELSGDKAISKWRSIIGPTDSEKAKLEAPSSIRGLYGTNKTKNAVHGSDAKETAQKEISFFFEDYEFKPCATLDNCTLCIIKPHAVSKGRLLISC
jgi:nucleoside-diphosphate kinase